MTAAGDAERHRRLYLANMRQELLAPAAAIVGYGELLLEAAAKADLSELLTDLEKIMSAARRLQGDIDQLLQLDAAQALFAGGDLEENERRLRHDLRTPINAIKGYGEMLLEDLEDLEGDALEADIRALLSEAEALLGKIDSIVDFSRREGRGTTTTEDTTVDPSGMLSQVAASIRPVDQEPEESRLKGHVLVVDDLASNRDLLTRRLTREGHRVREVDGGRAALRAVHGESFDLILLDLMMPEMNGFEVLARLKADEATWDIPVIMVSALDELDSVVRCIEAGAEDYLPKPFNPILLRARIKASLEKRDLRRREKLYLDRLEEEKARYENLLLNILPSQIVGRLNSGETLIADRFKNVTVLFADLVGFTEMSARIEPAKVVLYLNRLFSEFDRLVRDLGIEKIKMIGDSYMVVAGVPEARSDHAEVAAEMALRMMERLDVHNADSDTALQMRIGIHSGPVVAGVIGTHRFLYDVWGDTVNVASRLESHGVPSEIQISSATAKLLEGSYELESRGPIRIKGKGRLTTYFVRGRKVVTPAAS